MILRKQHLVLIFGITGKQGTFWGAEMIKYGTNVVGGVNPRKAGQEHLGLPVYASAGHAAQELDFHTALFFVPPAACKQATRDACEAGAKVVICLTEHIPVQDVMEMITIARLNGTQIIGPNTAGMVTPGEAFAGIMPGFNNKVFKEGSIGVISRSGSLGTLVCLNLAQSGFGQSVFYGIGGDPIIGTNTKEALKHLNEDRKTKAIVICGEIGGTAEEEASELARTIDKPVVAFIAGKSSPEGKKMGHAGAIVSGNSGSYKAKRSYLEKNGIQVADIPSQVPGLLKDNDGLHLQ